MMKLQIELEVGPNFTALLKALISNATLTRIEAKIDALLNQGEKMKLDLTGLLAAVAAETTIDNSVLALLTQVVQQNKDLSAQLAAAIASNDPAELAAVQKSIDESTATLTNNVAAIQKAITDNTPAAPTA